MPENKLTIETSKFTGGRTIEEVWNDLERMRKEYKQENKLFGCKLIKNDLLKGTQVMIKSGDKVYYYPDIKASEVKIIDIPEFCDTLPPFNPII